MVDNRVLIKNESGLAKLEWIHNELVDFGFISLITFIINYVIATIIKDSVVLPLMSVHGMVLDSSKTADFSLEIIIFQLIYFILLLPMFIILTLISVLIDKPIKYLIYRNCKYHGYCSFCRRTIVHKTIDKFSNKITVRCPDCNIERTVEVPKIGGDGHK